MSTATRAMTTAELLILASVAAGEFEGDYPGLSARVGALGCGTPYIELTLPGTAPVATRRAFLCDAGRAFGRRIEPVLDSAMVRVRDWQGLGVYLECRTRTEAVDGGRFL
ncbi:hypothetical protein SUDANB121_05968 (plasmid) [Nocardiopsis dassonvillei]|uniref:hypothetical protein n=1 Tax=Nocardiopsis dassonvillei TaxID=2014 RepID=UPI003F56BE55